MEQILKEFIDNNEAMDAYVTAKVTYISLNDVDVLLKKHKKQFAKCLSCGKNHAEICGSCVSDIAQETATQAISSR